jgi:FMN phosphatase YigB (HAD superfamily)
MTLTLLLDLDDTLLGNHIDSFVQPYLHSLTARLSPFVSASMAARQLMAATQAMTRNEDPAKTLEQVFDEHFFPALGIKRQDVQPALDRFYAEDFPGLRKFTTPFPEARNLVDQAARRDFRIGVATAPLFPLTAILQRLGWAGFAAGNHPFALIPSYESFHFTKPNPTYFAEFLGRMGWPEGPVVMVGNDLADDIAAARRLGLPAYWIDHGHPLPADLPGLARSGELPHGDLAHFFTWLDQTPPAQLLPNLDHPEGMRATLRATPAVLAGLAQDTPGERFARRPAPNEWAPVEIFCHLRDVDVEVNLPRFELIRQQPNPFIAGRNTDEWAESRQYIAQDARQALADFTSQRTRLLAVLDALSPADWELPVRHAIFGPSRLQELVRIIAEHDRLHIRQVYAALRPGNQA